MGQVNIDDNDALTEVVWTTAFEVATTLEIVDNEHLRRVMGTPVVRLAPTTRVTIARNPSLHDIEGFVGVEGLDGLAIQDNVALVAVSGWSVSPVTPRSRAQTGVFPASCVLATVALGELMERRLAGLRCGAPPHHDGAGRRRRVWCDGVGEGSPA